ncbi:MAG: hypothetical protein PHE20_03095 [Patescibacteria group bacterium]|nr:hypothetical protein [Patescibacteria group bacterium]
MVYNLHPIFVHFPIAFFLLYSLLRLVPWPKKFPVVAWQIPRIVILVVGLLGAWLANVTGDIASHLVKPNRSLVQMHESFAGASVNIYVVLLILELLIFIKPEWLDIKYFKSFKPYVMRLKQILTRPWLLIILAIAGAVAIAFTGLLGGVMVYGLAADPLAAPILNILGISI